ncbi:hypothetical protein YDYSG_01600 [Paenibacillus tyrfis]|uniref:hypothetical protein n=1 Tax=Paenibacillus TaxID=44249 RepID=UPI0024933136|nr:hypothetical protein [Paenibacillus tyrfis]GLI04130.1 hypothetical protein YDYSG_01600 [Paenibacillus tyrfis]GMX64871.1 hypothetical protein Elgi_41400 [Paenibacillus elgii]
MKKWVWIIIAICVIIVACLPLYPRLRYHLYEQDRLPSDYEISYGYELYDYRSKFFPPKAGWKRFSADPRTVFPDGKNILVLVAHPELVRGEHTFRFLVIRVRDGLPVMTEPAYPQGDFLFTARLRSDRWEPGEYRGEYWKDGSLVAVKTFTIQGKGPEAE